MLGWGERVKGTREERGVGMLPHLAAPVEEILDMFQIWAESLSIRVCFSPLQDKMTFLAL